MSTRHAFLLALLLSVASAACRPAESPGSGAASSSPPAAASVAAPRPAVHDGRPVEITVNDTMKYSTVELRATPGERLSVTLVSTGNAPKFSMGHNWLLLAAGIDVDAFLAAAAEAATTDYVPAAKRTEILAATRLLGPAERDTATFAAPATPGRYPFLCSFPGHAQVGMRGVLIVE
jgi:azurin